MAILTSLVPHTTVLATNPPYSLLYNPTAISPFSVYQTINFVSGEPSFQQQVAKAARLTSKITAYFTPDQVLAVKELLRRRAAIPTYI